MTHDPVFSELTARLKRVQALGSVGELLGWDEQVNLPPGGAEQRAAQHAALAEAHHAAASAGRIGELLAELEGGADALTADEKVVVAHARKDYDRATKLPADFVREKAAQGSRGYHAWVRAKASDDFAGYAPVLEKNLELARREAGYLGWGGREYDYMLDKHDPGLTAAAVERLFGELKRELVPLVREIAGAAAAERARAAAGKLRGFPVEAQNLFARGDGEDRFRLRARAHRCVAASVLLGHGERRADDDAVQGRRAARLVVFLHSRDGARTV